LLHCTKGNISDDQGLIEMLSANIDYFRRQPMNVHKITILLDHGYHPDFIMAELKKIYSQIAKKIRIERSAKMSPEEKKRRENLDL
jgi:hypothetical protein